jgi:hypothetical protein
MANQGSSAQRGKTASSHRLEKVDACLHSSTQESGAGQEGCRAILFLMDNPELHWIPRGLCRALAQRGYSSGVCQPDAISGNGQPQYQQARDCKYWLVPTTSIAAMEEYQFDHVVLLVPANLEAVLTAYQQIRQLARRNKPDIGVVLVGPRDQHSAWHYFRKLAVGALRYLNTPLLNLGFLPEQITPEHATASHHRNNFLARISERLLRSGFYTSYPAPKSVQAKV